VITLEKILLLKSVPFFQLTPEEFLLQIATTATTEQTCHAGDLILRKGDRDTHMYVLVSGKVRVHHEEQTLIELGEREIFGELSALSLEPRVSSVSAIDDCLLLKIDGAVLYDIMSVDIGLAKGIIRALCARARMMSEQMQVNLENP